MHRVCLSCAVAGAGALVATSAAPAAFVSMAIRFDEAATLAARAAGGALVDAQVYRMYALFDDPGNVVLNVFNVNIGTTNDSVLYQETTPILGGPNNTAPSEQLFGFSPTFRYDSFVTLNKLTTNPGGGVTTTVALDPSFAWGVDGVGAGGWATNDPTKLEGLSAFNSATGFHETLMAQFTLESATSSGFWVGDGGITFNKGLGTQTTQLSSWGPGIPGLTSPIEPYPIPAPGAVALLALAGFAGSRRRR